MLIQVDELKLALASRAGNHPEIVIFDCRYQLGKPNAGREAYEVAHIPGALYLDLERDLSSPVGPHGGRHPLPNLEELAQKFGAAGVEDATMVVVYDEGEGMAQRAWWLLRYCGHHKVRVLDGNFCAWQARGLPVNDDLPNPEPVTFHPNIQSQMVATLAEVEAASAGESDALLVDARARNRYQGEVEPLDAVAGHIPRARNAPWTEGVGDGGIWRDSLAQKQRFDALGANGQLVIHYCGSGVTACNNIFAMALAGLEAVKLYPGSYSDWLTYPTHQVAIGDE